MAQQLKLINGDGEQITVCLAMWFVHSFRNKSHCALFDFLFN